MKKALKTIILLPVLLLGACNSNGLSKEDTNARLNEIVGHVVNKDYVLPENINLDISAKGLAKVKDLTSGKEETMYDIKADGSVGVNLKDLVVAANANLDMTMLGMASSQELNIEFYAFVEDGNAYLALNDGLEKTYMMNEIPAQYSMLTLFDFTKVETLLTLSGVTDFENFEVPELDVSEVYEILDEEFPDQYNLKFTSSGNGNLRCEGNINVEPGENGFMSQSASAVLEVKDYKFDRYTVNTVTSQDTGKVRDEMNIEMSVVGNYSKVVSKPFLDGYTKVDVIDFSAINNLFDGILDGFLY